MPYVLIPPGKRRGNRYWIARGRTPDQREFEVSTRCTDKAGAERTAALAFARLCADRPAAAPVEPTFHDAAQAYIRWRSPVRADLERIERLCRLLGAKPVTEIGQDDIVRAAGQHQRNVSGATLNREYVRPFAAVLHYARDAGMRGDIRVRAFPERAPVVRVATRDQLAILIGNAETDAQRLLLEWLWAMGSRLGDTLRVTWDALDLQAGTVRLAIGKRAGAVVVLPLPADLRARLANLPVQRGRLFPWSSRSGVYKWLRPLCQRLGVAFRPHDARRALATDHFDAGADARLVQELMGHGSVKSTMRYRHVGLDRLAAAQRKRRG